MKIGFFGPLEEEKKIYYKNSLPEHELKFYEQNIDEENHSPENDLEIISIFVRSKITKEIIDSLPNLKMIAIRSTGFDNVDLEYAKSKNITVCNVPAYGSHTVAEFTFGLILSLSRKLPQSIEKVKTETEFDHTGLRGFDLYGKTLGVIGTGKIGANVIKIAKGFGMIVFAFDMYPNEKLSSEFNFQYVPLEQLLKESDIVTLHVPSTPESHHLINNENIFQMKKGALLINTSRGDVIESEALYKAINQDHLSGAGLDVLEDESKLSENIDIKDMDSEESKKIMADNMLIKSPKVFVTPHSAFYTKEAEEAIMQTTVENIQKFISGNSQNLVKN